MHTHNDLEMATANAIAGILGGASHVGLTVNGLEKEQEMQHWKKY